MRDNEKKIVDQFAFKYVGTYYALIEKYGTAKKYAKEVVLRKMGSDTTIARLYTLTYALNSPINHIFEPWQINDQLVNDIQSTIDKIYGNIEVEDNESPVKKFFNQRDLREKVLEYFEKKGIFLHLEDKEEIKSHQGGTHRPGRKKSFGYNDRGGKPSAYLATEYIEKVKQVMENPAAIELLYERIIRSGIAHQFFKFLLLASLYASKMDERVIHRTAGVGASFFQHNIKEKQIADYKAMFERIKGI